MAKVVAFNTNRQMNINANQERQLSRKFRCLSKEQKIGCASFGVSDILGGWHTWIRIRFSKEC